MNDTKSSYKTITVARKPGCDKARLHIRCEEAWRLHAVPASKDTEEHISRSHTKPILSGTNGGEFTVDVPRDRRTYFKFTAPSCRVITAERRLPVEGSYNMRDLGGYPTSDGRLLKWGMLIRSDDLYALQPQGAQYLASVPIDTVVDFRAAEETAEAPDRNLPAYIQRIHLPITPGRLNDTASYMNATESEADAMMHAMYGELVTSGEAVSCFRRFFEILHEPSSKGVLFHCSAGTDRTGMAAAFLLSALGVPEHIITEDYMVSNSMLEGKYDWYTDQYPQLKPMFIVRREFLHTAFDTITARYGSVHDFLTGTIGIRPETLRKKYLYDPTADNH